MTLQLARIFYCSKNKNITRLYPGSTVSFFKKTIEKPNRVIYTGVINVQQLDWRGNDYLGKLGVGKGYVEVKLE